MRRRRIAFSSVLLASSFCLSSLDGKLFVRYYWRLAGLRAFRRREAEELTADNVSMSEAWKKGGLVTSDILNHRLEMRFTSGGKLEVEIGQATNSPMSWDAAAGIYTVDGPAAKAVVGRCTGKTTKLEGAEFDVKANPRNFAVLTLNAVDGQPMTSQAACSWWRRGTSRTLAWAGMLTTRAWAHNGAARRQSAKASPRESR